MLTDRDRNRRHLIVFHRVETDTDSGSGSGSGSACASASASASASAEVPPILIDEIAVDEWHRVAPMLARNGRLTALQQTLLVGYCTTLAKAMRAEDTLAREGSYYEAKTRGGTVMKRHPAVVDAEKSWNALRQFARQLGIGAATQPAPQAMEPRRAIFK